jgi:hypothetical protein
MKKWLSQGLTKAGFEQLCLGEMLTTQKATKQCFEEFCSCHGRCTVEEVKLSTGEVILSLSHSY